MHDTYTNIDTLFVHNSTLELSVHTKNPGGMFRGSSKSNQKKLSISAANSFFREKGKCFSSLDKSSVNLSRNVFDSSYGRCCNLNQWYPAAPMAPCSIQKGRNPCRGVAKIQT
jgi:hypothetical protein